jgi:hypothetical protein
MRDVIGVVTESMVSVGGVEAPGHACDPIACFSGVRFLTVTAGRYMYMSQRYVCHNAEGQDR